MYTNVRPNSVHYQERTFWSLLVHEVKKSRFLKHSTFKPTLFWIQEQSKNLQMKDYGKEIGDATNHCIAECNKIYTFLIKTDNCGEVCANLFITRLGLWCRRSLEWHELAKRYKAEKAALAVLVALAETICSNNQVKYPLAAEVAPPTTKFVYWK
jgi:hypothetical protein